MVTSAIGVLALMVLAAGGQNPAGPELSVRTEIRMPPVLVTAVHPRGERGQAVAPEADAELSTRLLDRVLKAGHLNKGCLAIAASDSSVRLEGVVRSKADRAAIERIVASEPGVLRVISFIQTGSCSSKPGRRQSK